MYFNKLKYAISNSEMKYIFFYKVKIQYGDFYAKNVINLNFFVFQMQFSHKID